LRAGKKTATAFALGIAVVVCATVSAHRRDEYLHAARLAIEPGRVDLELDLTPGIAVAETIIARLDHDGDGRVSPAEEREYVDRMLRATVLDIDGHALLVEPIRSTFPALNDFRRGNGTIQIQAVAALPPQAPGDHHLSLRHTNQGDASVFLANAFVPTSDRVIIMAQRRDPTQRSLTIDYVLRPPPVISTPISLLGTVAGVAVLAALLIRPPKTQDARRER
jgi:hypothetical protein